MAKSLSDLLQIKGVIGSAEFSVDGRLIDYRSNDDRLNAEAAALAAQFSAAINQSLNAFAQAHSKISGINWQPQRGWAYWGGELSLVQKLRSPGRSQ